MRSNISTLFSALYCMYLLTYWTHYLKYYSLPLLSWRWYYSRYISNIVNRINLPFYRIKINDVQYSWKFENFHADTQLSKHSNLLYLELYLISYIYSTYFINRFCVFSVLQVCMCVCMCSSFYKSKKKAPPSNDIKNYF